VEDHRGNNDPSPHLTFPIWERDFSEIGRLSLGCEDKSLLLSSHPRLNDSGEGEVITMHSALALLVFAFLCVACPESVEGWVGRPTSEPPPPALS
jgi:hypothetical protein